MTPHDVLVHVAITGAQHAQTKREFVDASANSEKLSFQRMTSQYFKLLA